MEFRPSNQESIVSRLIELVESNLRNSQFGVSELASEMGMSRSNLHRKIKSITNLTVSQFIRRIRLKKALELLRESTLTITEVAIECGFHSLTYFTKCFNDYYGAPPSKFNSVEVPADFLHIPRRSQHKKRLIPVRATQLLMVIPLFILIAVALMIIFYKPAVSKSPAVEKTIAVFLLGDQNPDSENGYLVNGLMSEIREKLRLIGGLKMVALTSVEGYLDNGNFNGEIGKELNVNYILGGKSRDIQGKTWMDFQLFDVINNEQLWSEPYVTELTLENSFEVQKEIVWAVTNELKTKLALNEKEQIEQNPTKDIVAYNLFLLGKDHLKIHSLSLDTEGARNAIMKAKKLFEQALERDSTFSDASASLGSIYVNHLYKMASGGSLDKARSYLDSGLVILDKALLYDPENVIALQKKAEYCEKIGEYQEAERLYDQLSEFGELGYEYYHGEVMKFPHIKNYYGAIDSYLKYLKQKPKQLIVSQYMLRKIMAIFRETGFPELEKQMARHLFEFSSDSALLYRYMISAELYQERFDPALEYALEGNRLDPANYIFTDLIALCYAYQEDFKMAFNYTVLIEDTAEKRGPVVRPGYIPGYIYLMNGYEAQADYHFKKEIARRLKEIEYARPQAQQCESHLYLAGTFLALGNEVKALDYLKQLKSLKAINYGHIMMLTRWPGFESIRNTPEYLDVLKNLNSKYLHQHQRIQVLIDKADLDPSLN